MNKYLGTLGRVLLAQLFLIATIIQVSQMMNMPDGYAAYQVFLGQHGLAGIFAPLTILIQLLGGLALFLGFKTKVAAYVLAGYSLFVAFALHINEPLIFLQYLAITGGMLTLALNSVTACSLDNLKK